MRYEDERYIRLYTRDTVTWKLLPWQSKAVHPLLMRKIDRAGLVDLGDNAAEGLAALIDLPVEVAGPGLQGLLDRGCVVSSGTMVVVPNFMHAQECRQSDKARKQAERERARAKVIAESFGQPVTPADEVSRTVTTCPAGGRNVTTGHTESQPVTPSRAVPCRAGPSQEDPPNPLSDSPEPDSRPSGMYATEPAIEPTKAERLASSEALWRDAYEIGILAGKGEDATFCCDETQQGTLNTIVTKHGRRGGKALRGEALLSWIRETAQEFVEDIVASDSARYAKGFQPRGFNDWLNSRVATTPTGSAALPLVRATTTPNDHEPVPHAKVDPGSTSRDDAALASLFDEPKSDAAVVGSILRKFGGDR